MTIEEICKRYNEQHVYSRLSVWNKEPDGKFEIRLASPYGRSYYTYYTFASVHDFRMWQEQFGCGL